MKAGGTAPAILNAANEVAVEAFLQKRIAFTEIAHVIEGVLGLVPSVEAKTLECVLEADGAARACATLRVGECEGIAA